MLALPIQVAAMLVVMFRFKRSGLTDGLRYSAAAVLSFLLFCKVLSPQFLIWLFPFLAALEGRRGRLAQRVFLLAVVSTALFYPGPGYAMMLDHELIAILLLNLRNCLLVWLLAVLLWESRGPANEMSSTTTSIPVTVS
jgi:hypothetical protein